MGVLHHLEEVMSLPPLSPRKSCRNVKTSPSPLMHWGETCTYLSKHCFCFFFLLSLHVQKWAAFLFFFDMAICIFVFEIWPRWLFLFVCQRWFDVVCVGPSRERCGERCVSDTADDTEAWRVAKHLSDSCLWGFMIQIWQCSLCFTVASHFFFLLTSVFEFFASFCNWWLECDLI